MFHTRRTFTKAPRSINFWTISYELTATAEKRGVVPFCAEYRNFIYKVHWPQQKTYIVWSVYIHSVFEQEVDYVGLVATAGLQEWIRTTLEMGKMWCIFESSLEIKQDQIWRIHNTQYKFQKKKKTAWRHLPVTLASHQNPGRDFFVQVVVAH